MKPVLVHIEKEQALYLKRNGMVRSRFMRQAIEAHRRGDWDYDFMDIGDEEE